MTYEKICVYHLNQIGDLAFSLPVLAAFRQAYPGAEIHSVVKPYLAELLDGSGLVDRIHVREGSRAGRKRLLGELRRERFDLFMSLPRSEEALLFAALSGAKVRAGFANRPWDLGLDVRVGIEGHHGWTNNRRLLEALGVPVLKDDYVGLLTAPAAPEGLGLPERYVVISPGASARRQVKAWDEEKFAELGVRLFRDHGLVPVLVGSAENAGYNAGIIRDMHAGKCGADVPVVDLSGRVGLKDLCGVLGGAALFVGIDSGVMHLASVLDLPVVGLFGPTDEAYVRPQNEMSRVVREHMECTPCYLKPTCADIDCMRRLSVEKVYAACEELLEVVHGQ